MPARNYIAVLEKAARVLTCLEEHGPGVTLQEAARHSGLVKSSAFRLLFTLEKLGFVQRQEPGGVYRLGPRLLRLAATALQSRDLNRTALPFMETLLSRFQETVNLGVLDHGQVLYIQVLESPHTFRLAARAGLRSSLHSTAMGKSLLAYLPEYELNRLLEQGLTPLTSRTITNQQALRRELARVRKRGYAVDNQEDSDGARCVGAPVFDASKRVVAAMSISGPATRMTFPRMAEMAREIRAACLSISRELGWQPDPSGQEQRP